MRARRLAIAIAALCALAGVADWVLGQLSLERHRAVIERELSAVLGREVRLGGELRFDLLPQPALEATHVVVANPPGRASPDLLRIDRLRLVLALRSLLHRRLEIVRLDVDGGDLRLEVDDEDAPDLLPTLARLVGEEAPPELPLAIRIDRIELADVHVAWQDIARGAVTTLDVDDLDVVAEGDDEPIEWSVHGSFRGESFAFEGRGGTLAALLHPGGPWPVALAGRVGQATLRVDGEVAQPTRLEGLALDVEVELEDVGSLLATARGRPGLGAARMRGHWSDPDGEHRLERVVVESDPDAELRLRASGSVRRLADPSGIELDFEIDADRLRFLELLLERPMPEGRLHASFRISDRDGTLGADGEAHVQSRDGSLRVDVSGGFGDLPAVDDLDAALRVAAPDLNALGRIAGLDRELPALGPVAASARVLARAGRVGVEGLELDAGRRDESWLSLRGSVRDLQALRGVALDASAGARSLAALGLALRPRRSLPDLENVELHAKLGDARGALAVEHFQLRGGTPATLAVDLTGRVADLRRLDAVDLEGHVRARDAAFVGAFFDADLPPVGPVAFDGRASGSDERIESQGSATLGRTRIEGRVSAELAGRARPRIAAELHSAHLRLEDLGLGAAAAAEASGPWHRASPRRRGEPLELDRLRRLDARLELRAARVTAGSAVEVRNAHLRIDLEDGDLRVRDAAFGYEGGRVAGELRIDARTPDPDVALRVDADALDLERLGVATGQPDLTGSGQLDLALDVRSEGDTPDALREGLAGRAAFAARDWSAASPLARRFLLDLTRAVVPELRRAPERLGCFRGEVVFAGGEARVESLVLAGERATVVGAGSIDLVRERWKLELVPEIHDPGLLEVASAVRVTGPLMEPRFKTVPLSLVAGTLRGLARGALSPARKVAAGAERALGPFGRLLAPVRFGLGLGARKAADPSACVLPRQEPEDSCREGRC